MMNVYERAKVENDKRLDAGSDLDEPFCISDNEAKFLADDCLKLKCDYMVKTEEEKKKTREKMYDDIIKGDMRLFGLRVTVNDVD